MTTVVVSLTRDQREVIARKLGIADPDALRPEDLLKLPRSRSFEDGRFERDYLDALGVEPRPIEYEAPDDLTTAEREWNEFSVALGVKAEAR